MDPSAGDLSDRVAGYGILKVVDPGVVYCPPPMVEELVLWEPIPGGRGRSFAMPWSEDESPRYRALLDFHAGLAARRAGLTKDDEELRQFDAAILDLVRLTARLHKAGGTLGYLQPQSVLMCHRRDGGTHIVLPDLGFFWDEEHGLREPKWIAEPALDLLFEHGSRRRNADCLRAYRDGVVEMGKRAVVQATAQVEDVRLLARLIAVSLAGAETVRTWCGQGRSLLGMPGRDKAPDTLAPIWDQVISPALLGRVSSCDELLLRLEASKPSEHYLYKPPAPPPLWRKALRQAAPAMAGVGLIVAAAALAPLLYGWLFPPCNPHPLCQQVCASSPMFAKLDDVEMLRQRALSGADVAAVAAYWDALEALTGMPLSCRENLRRECGGLVGRAARELVESLRRRPRPRSEELQLLAQAASLLRRAEAAPPARESPSGDLLDHQIRLRGGGSAAPLGGGASPKPR